MKKCPKCKNVLTPQESGKATLRCSQCGTVASKSTNKKRTSAKSGDRISGSDAARSRQRRGQYEFIGQLGQGSFGTVWKARDTRLHRIVALKIPRNRGSDKDRDAEFLKEARAVAQLNHPGIVRVYEVGNWGDQPYIATEFIEGTDLREFLKETKVEFAETVNLIDAMCSAFHAAHQAGIVHRDIKPANVMIDLQRRPHVMDFGLAKDIDSEDATMTVAGTVMGTPAYMSPEQARGESHLVDARSDIYSLGVILFEMLTGELPFRGRSVALLNQVIHDDPPEPRRLNATIPIELQNICLKCLEKHPDHRYESAAAFSQDLRAFLNHRPVSARPLTRIQRTWKWCYRNPTVASLLGLTAACLIAVCMISVVFLVSERRHRKSLQAALARETVATDLSERASEELRTQNERLVAAQGMAKSVLQHMTASRNEQGASLVAMFTAESSGYLREGRLLDCWNSYSRFQRAYGQETRESWEMSFLKKSLDLRASWPVKLHRHLKQVWITDAGRVLVAHDDHGQLLRVNLTAPIPKARALLLDKVESARLVAISRDGSKRAVLSDDSTIHAFDQHWVNQGAFDGLSERKVQHFALCDSGTYLAVADVEGVISVHDTQTREESSRWQCDISGQELFRLSWAPDEKIVAVITDRAIHYFDPASGARVNKISMPSTPIAFDWFPDGSAMAVAGKWGVSVVSPEGVEAKSLPSDLVDVTSIRIDSKGQICTLNRAGYFTRSDATSGRSGPSDQLFDRAGQYLVGPNDDGRMVAVDEEGNVCLVSTDAREFAPPAIVRHSAPVRRIAWSPDDRYLAAADWSGKCVIWDTATMRRHRELTTCSSRNFCESAEWSPDGKLLVTCSNDGTMQLWDVASGAKTQEFEPVGHALFCLSWHPNLDLIATGGPDGIVRLWDLDQQRPSQLLSMGKIVEQVRWSRDGKTLAVIGDDCYFGELVEGRLEPKDKRAMGTRLFDIVQSPFGAAWTVVDSSGEVHQHEIGSATKRFRLTSRELRSVRFSPGGVSLATCDIQGNVQLSDPVLQRKILRVHDTENLERPYRGWHIDFSHDGTRLAVCFASGEIRIWDTR